MKKLLTTACLFAETAIQAANKGKVARTYATGSFGEIVSMRARDFWKKNSSWTSYLGSLNDLFPVFLLGLYAGRRRIFNSVSNNRKFISPLLVFQLNLQPLFNQQAPLLVFFHQQARP